MKFLTRQPIAFLSDCLTIRTLTGRINSANGRGLPEAFRRRVFDNRTPPVTNFTIDPRALIAFMGRLEISEGPLAGQALQVLPFQKRFIRACFDPRRKRAPGEPLEAALSIARGNAKTTTCAALAVASLVPDAPLHRRRGQTVLVASSFQQSRVAFLHVRHFLQALLGVEFDDRKVWRVWDSANLAALEHIPTGARLQCIASDPRRAHGLAPSLLILDEPAQWPPATADAMLAALRTSAGKQTSSVLLAIGTRPADEGHWFTKMLAGFEGTVAHCYAASKDPEKDPPFRLATWKKANPAINYFPDLVSAIRREAKAAKRDPAQLASFRALRLNTGTSDVERAELVSAEAWTRAEGDVPREGARIFGIDLGTTAALSAIACCWLDSGRMECLAAFPSEPSLAERGARDGVGELYSRMFERAELAVLGGAVVPVDQLLDLACERFGPPDVLLADRWREGELLDALTALNLPAPFVARGQGFKDGAEDVRDFRRGILTGEVRPVRSLLLRSAMREAVTVADPAGNEKLAKSTQGGRRRRARDDAAAAGILAAAHTMRLKARPVHAGPLLVRVA